MDEQIQSLLHAAEIWEKIGYMAAAVVVAGIVLESVELFRDVRGGKAGGKKLEILGLGVLILGLIGEVISQVQSNNRTGLVISALNRRASEANKAANYAAKAAADMGVTVDNIQGFVRKKETAADRQLTALKIFIAADEARNATVISQLEQSRDKLRKAQRPKRQPKEPSGLQQKTADVMPFGGLDSDLSQHTFERQLDDLLRLPDHVGVGSFVEEDLEDLEARPRLEKIALSQRDVGHSSNTSPGR